MYIYINMFVSDVSGFGKYSQKKIEVSCDNCGIHKEVIYKNYTKNGYRDGEFFCRKCKTEKNNMEKYGVKNVFQLESVKKKAKETNLKKYGVEYISQSKEIQDKIKETYLDKYGETHPMKNEKFQEKHKEIMLDKYGVDNISKLEHIKQQKKDTCMKNHGEEYIFHTEDFMDNLIERNLETYGVSYSFQAEVVKDKIKKTNLERYGSENVSKNPKIIAKKRETLKRFHHNRMYKEITNLRNIDSDNKIFQIYCEHCEDVFDITHVLYYKRRETRVEICTKCNEISRNISGKEIAVSNFIKSNYEGTILNNHRIDGKELDIYLPDIDLAFEFNGVYYHSELFKGTNYHLDKTKMCEQNNIQLIHIWEDDWDFKRDIIESMILYKLNKVDKRIHGRKCTIKEITDNTIIKDFLNENHIQGHVGSSIKIGLYHENELVSLMTFKKDKDSHLLNRYCTKLNTIVNGGSSKLLKYFIKHHTSNITTFSNNSYSNGMLYENLGFKKIKELKPDYSYVVSGIRIHKFNFRNKDTSNLYKIYDAGKVKFSYI